MTLDRVLETGLTTAGAAAIGLGTGLVVGEQVIGGVALAAIAALSAGINGFFSGRRRVYKWNTVGGWYAWIADSSWALITTTLGNVVNIVNVARRGSGYEHGFSFRQNRHVYEGGFFFKRRFANTQGPVISNAATGHRGGLESRREFIDRHETLHVWQQRWFGPIHPFVYVVWAIGGVLVAVAYWVATPRRSEVPLTRLIETTAYYDNPFEYWAYRNDDHWDNNSALRVLKWGR